MNLLAMVIVFYAEGVMASVPHCKQLVYDAIYRTVLEHTIDSDLGKEAFRERNAAIETLRDLCNGQKSSFETGHVLGTQGLPRKPKKSQ